MGMDLVGADLSYNWSGWAWLSDHLRKWGVDTSELKFFNDGDRISQSTCQAIAQAIEQHLHELSPDDRKWLEPHIERWRCCEGCEQW